jgi:hypothetical protein
MAGTVATMTAAAAIDLDEPRAVRSSPPGTGSSRP